MTLADSLNLWRRWSHYERRWRGDKRSVLISLLVQGAVNKRAVAVAQWSKIATLPQPTEDEVKELSYLGDRLQEINRMPHPLPDVYAAACYIKDLSYGRIEYGVDRTYGFRGTRNACWPLIPTIQRPSPGEREPTKKELAERWHVLALFCEALRQLLRQGNVDPPEIIRIAIAQHYGIASPLVDLTWSPWVALFFASHKAEQGHVGIVQRFSIAALRDVLGAGFAGFGALQVLEADFVPRIKAQQGFFMEFPALDLDKQVVPWDVRFHQIPGILFEDKDLDISESLLYPSAADDRFAPFADPKLTRFTKVLAPRPTTVKEYVIHLGEWCPYQGDNPVFKSRVRELAAFHTRLQSIHEIRDYERSITRLHCAYGTLLLSADEGRMCEMSELVDCYVNIASDRSTSLISELWDAMKVEDVAGS